MAPAKVKEINVEAEAKKAAVLFAQDQVSLAIGRGGQNVRLASKLTGFDIQVLKEGGEEEEYDMDLSEFREELGDVLFHKFFDEGYESVRDVIETSKEELVATLGVETQKIEEILEMLKKGLEEAEVENEEENSGVPSATTAAPARLVESAATAVTVEASPAEPSAETPESSPEVPAAPQPEVSGQDASTDDEGQKERE
ncbi:MAG: hypothetical protein A3C56_11130 [Ignavibacteria bacterium RIFCSPHIGHO2_02_FULL_56_12]|nr:MAG: hypothetical protein A3C56_11130 [Ignavibacteria bacterium RIFCSPHIGHO2_02_FULL_56_12]